MSLPRDALPRRASDVIELLLRLLEELRLVSRPADFAGLEQRGIILRDVDRWWRVPNARDLPRDAAHQITEMEFDCISPRVRFGPPHFKQECREMERFTAQLGLDQLPHPPAFNPGPTEGEGVRFVAAGDSVAVRSSSGRGAFLVRVLNVARCTNCGAWIVWARTAGGRKIPLNPWALGSSVTTSHFKICRRRHRPWGQSAN